jgi:hypothetical protein
VPLLCVILPIFMASPESMAEQVVVLRQSTVGQVGSARVGVGNVVGETATLHVSRADRRDGPSVQLKVRAAELAPFAGAFHRVIMVRDAGQALKPGGSRSEVHVAAQPEAGAPALSANGLAVPVGALAQAGGFDLTVVSVGADASATVEVWPGELARVDTAPELIKRFTVKRGEALPTGTSRLSVLNVLVGTAQGLPSCVELGF